MNSQDQQNEEPVFIQFNYDTYCLECQSRAVFDCLSIRGTCEYGHALCVFKPKIRRSESKDKQEKLF